VAHQVASTVDLSTEEVVRDSPNWALMLPRLLTP
jgi:hypothetical protein